MVTGPERTELHMQRAEAYIDAFTTLYGQLPAGQDTPSKLQKLLALSQMAMAEAILALVRKQ